MHHDSLLKKGAWEWQQRSTKNESKACRNASITSGGIFDIAAKKKRAGELEAISGEGAFWNDTKNAQTVLKEAKDLKRTIGAWEKLKTDCDDMVALYDLATGEQDASTLAEVPAHIDAVEKETNHMEFVRKMSGEDDAAPASLSIHSGAGGTESCDWCEILFRMYCRWMERKGFSYTVLDSIPGEGAGLKSVEMEVQGEYAYGHLKAECGVHRLVRISPFDANARRHTSFASVYAYPLLEETSDFELEEKEIRIDTYRASGAGGQHINKTDSAVRMTHIPTGIVVQCQNERSQIKNRAVAMRLLKSKVRQHLKEIEDKERQGKLAEKKKIEWGSQIRSYVLHPYNMVKDHRTETETSNARGVLDGDLDQFIESYLLNFG